MADDFFLSYARKDGADFADDLHNALEGDGYTIWLDTRDIHVGETWDDSIQEGIKSCQVLLFVMTPGSAASKVCRAEWGYALDQGKQIFPLYFMDCDIPMLLRPMNYIDFRADFDKGIAQLRTALKAFKKKLSDASDASTFAEYSVRSGAFAAELYRPSDEVRELTRDGLFGRDALKAQIEAELQKDNARVLLQAFGGTGKTALAAHIAQDWLKNDADTKVLWLKLGASETAAAFEALAQPFGASAAVAGAADADKPKVLRQLITQAGVKLLVLDDVWNGASLEAIHEAIPRSVALLVTARQSYPLRKIIAIPDLAEDDSVALLREIAGNLMHNERAAHQLCRKLKNLAFAIEIAGRTMQAKGYSAQELLQSLADVTALEVPLEFRKEGRETVAALIQTSLDALPEEARTVFFAWGAFWSTHITPEMMNIYVGTMPALSDGTPENTEENLNLLYQYGLATRQAAVFEGEEKQYPVSAAHYILHELAHLFAQTQNNDEAHNRALDACLSYTKRYNEPSRENFAALVPELDNFMGAAAFAMQQGRYSDVERFAWDLYGGGGTGFLNIRGYYTQAINLLEQAVDASEKLGNQYNQGAFYAKIGLSKNSLGQYQDAIKYHDLALQLSQQIGDKKRIGQDLGNLSNAYADLGQYQKSIEYLEQVLTVGIELKDKQMQGNTLGNLGIAYYSLGQYEQAIEYHKQALIISREIGDKRGEGQDLGNLGIAYKNLGQYEQAIEYHQQSLEVAREIGHRQGEGAELGNLGNAYRNLGQYEQAIEYHKQALAISQEIGDKRGEGHDLGNLGIAYSSLGQYEKAIDYYQQAVAISREIGDKQSEGADLGNLGIAYADLGQYEQVIDYHKQALAIAEEIGDKQSEGADLGNLGLAYADLGQYEQAIDYHKQALAISREIGDKRAEGQDLGNLGIAYSSLGQTEQAIDYHKQSVEVAREIGNKSGEGVSLGNLGLAYYSLGQYEQAIDYHQQALVIAEEIGDIHGKEQRLGYLGSAYFGLKQYDKSINYYQHALAISHEIGDRYSESSWLNNLGVVYEELEDYEQAIAYYEQAAALYRAMGVNHSVEMAERNLEEAKQKRDGGEAGA